MNFFKVIMSFVFVVASCGINPRGGGGGAAMGAAMGLTTGVIVGSAIASNNRNAKDDRVERELAEVRQERSQDKIDRLQRENDNLRNDLRDLKRRLDDMQGSEKGAQNKKIRY